MIIIGVVLNILSSVSVFSSISFNHNYIIGVKIPISCTNEFKCENCYDFLNDGTINDYPGGSFCRGVPFDLPKAIVVNIFLMIIGTMLVVPYLKQKKSNSK